MVTLSAHACKDTKVSSNFLNFVLGSYMLKQLTLSLYSNFSCKYFNLSVLEQIQYKHGLILPICF